MMVNFEPLKPVDPSLFKDPPSETTVLIVGGGPAGLLAALLLAKHNIRSVVLEKHAYRTGQPKAHAINPRSLEIFRQYGLDVKELRKLGSPYEDSQWVRFVTTMTGTSIGELPYERQDEAVKSLTPEPLFNIAQPILEEYLQDVALKTGLVSIHRRFEWQSYETDLFGFPVSHVLNRETSGIIHIKSRFVLGTDGTESSVRRQMQNIEWNGLPGQSSDKRYYVSIHVKGDLRPRMKALDRYAELYFCFHPKHKNGIIVYDLSSSWVYTRVVDPIQEPIETWTQEKCRDFIDPSVGPGLKYDVASVNIWYTSPRIASSYATPDLRVFLAGDAAHTFPPQGGLGINTGIGDVHNLVWKLAFAIQDPVPSNQGAPILSTYSKERIPVATANALQSFVNETRWQHLLSTAENAVSHISPDDDAAIDAEYLKSEVRKPVDEAIEFNRPHFDSLALQLGYVYRESDGTELLPNCSDFQPTAKPGARLPHCWLPDGRSILDLVSEKDFTLISDGGSIPAFEELDYYVNQKRFSVNIVNIDEIQAPDEWKRLVGLSNGGGLLVRPDQHILKNLDQSGTTEFLSS